MIKDGYMFDVQNWHVLRMWVFVLLLGLFAVYAILTAMWKSMSTQRRAVRQPRMSPVSVRSRFAHVPSGNAAKREESADALQVCEHRQSDGFRTEGSELLTRGENRREAVSAGA